MTQQSTQSIATLFPAMRTAQIVAGAGNVLACGTQVMTSEGLLPVEYLTPGDRIITRNGMRELRDIDTPAPQCFELTFDQAEVIYADGEEVCIAA